jgi:hypothetical protein
MNFVVNSRIDTESTLERSASISISTVRSGGAHGIRQPREVRVRNGIRLYHHRWHTRRRKPNPRVSFCAARRSPIAATGRTINRSNPVHSGSSRMILRAVLGHQNCPSTSKVTKVLVSKASAPFTISP